MVDWKRIEELVSEIGEDGFAEVVDLFLEEMEEVVSRLRTAPDPSTYEVDLHFLKGGAWNLGFTNFGLQCNDGEKRAANGRAAEIDIAAIVGSYEKSKDTFLAGLASRAGGATSAA